MHLPTVIPSDSEGTRNPQLMIVSSFASLRMTAMKSRSMSRRKNKTGF
jgi:hypothetical protein